MSETSLASPPLTLIEEQAYQLARTALAIDGARARHGADSPEARATLQDNLMVWVAIRTVAQRPDCTLMPEAKKNLVDLCNFMADKAFSPDSLIDKTLDMIININLQISEGLLEGEKRARGA